MSVKSIFDIEINDSKFRDFEKLFDKYQKALKSTPAAWKLVNDKIDGSRSSFDKLVSTMAAANVQEKLRAKAQEQADRLTRTTADRWAGIARSTRTFTTNIKEATTAILKWGSITGIISGLAGAGGIWGLDRLALSVGSARRSALGSGTSIGGQAAFGANAQRFLSDPDSFLSSIGSAKFDITKQVGLRTLGGDAAGDTTDNAIKALRTLKREADTWNPLFYQQMLDNLQQSQFSGVTPELLSVLHQTSGGEFEQNIKQIGQRRGQFDQPPEVAKAWQDFTTQMSNAGKGIEATFVRGLAKIEPGLEKLSGSVEKTIETFLQSDTLVNWLKELDDGVEKFARYIGTPEFQKNVEDFVIRIGEAASALGRFLSWFGGSPASSSPHGASVRDRGRRAGWLRDEATPKSGPYTTMDYLNHILGGSQTPVNNPGNLRVPGSTSGFQHFANPELGIAAMARQLRLYENRDHLDTLAGVISKYAPASENDTAAYIGDVSKRTGFGSNQHLNLNDSGTLAQVLAAMVAHEQKRGTFDKYKDAKVVVEVLNNTGGNATVTVNGLKN